MSFYDVVNRAIREVVLSTGVESQLIKVRDCDVIPPHIVVVRNKRGRPTPVWVGSSVKKIDGFILSIEDKDIVQVLRSTCTIVWF